MNFWQMWKRIARPWILLVVPLQVMAWASGAWPGTAMLIYLYFLCAVAITWLVTR